MLSDKMTNHKNTTHRKNDNKSDSTLTPKQEQAQKNYSPSLEERKNQSLDVLLRRSDIWQASAANEKSACIPTGYKLLDEQLHGNGWPADAITEFLTDKQGIGEMRLLTPTLAHFSQQQRWITLIAPPYIPYAPALAERGIDTAKFLVVHPKTPKDLLWAAEQALRSDTCSTVITWLPQKGVNDKDLRRLQLAAQQGHSIGMLFRPTSVAQQPSPAALRLKLSHNQHKAFNNSLLHINILKQRGGWGGQSLQLILEEHLEQPRLKPCDLPVYQGRKNNTSMSEGLKVKKAANGIETPLLQ